MGGTRRARCSESVTRAIMIDAGTGVSRLVERPDLVDGIESLDILLSHFHLDHIAGLAYLPAIELSSRTTVWGPGKLLYGQLEL